MAPVPYTKPCLSIDDQLQLLKSRGMGVTDDVRAKQYLERIGYYRLSGYWYPFRQSRIIQFENGKIGSEVLDQFRHGTEFQHAVELYVFDKLLRLLLIDAIERIEIALRVQIAQLLGSRDPWAHRNPAELHGSFTKKINSRTGQTHHQDWMGRFGENERRSKEDFVKHFRSRYSSDLPIWIAVELWDFGLLSIFFEGMKNSDQMTLAARYGIARPELLVSWTRAINHIRNICAHHSRLWNISPADQPKVPKSGEIPLLQHLVGDTFGQTRLYAAAAVIQFLLRTVNPATSWATRLKQHLTTFPQAPGVNVSQTGFPAGWESLSLWI